MNSNSLQHDAIGSGSVGWKRVGVAWLGYLLGLGLVGRADAPSIILLYIGVGGVTLLALTVGASRGPNPRKVAVAILTAIAFPVVTYGALAGFVGLAYVFPPPRPLFRNMLIEPNLGLFPIWFQPMWMEDSPGNRAVADRFDNLIVIIMANDDAKSRAPRSRFAFDSLTLEFGEPTGLVRTVNRQNDRLLVFTPEADSHEFQVVPNAARDLEKQHYDDSSQPLLQIVSRFIDDAARAELERLAEGSTKRSGATP